MGPDLSMYGVPEVHTPNIDALAAKGMVFDQAFTTAPICSISRSALFTGMYATSIGAHHHRTAPQNMKDLPDGVKLLTHHFEDAGYHTALLTTIGEPETDDEWVKGTTKTDWNFNYRKPAYLGSDMGELKDKQPFFAQAQFKETHRGVAWDEAIDFVDIAADPNKVDIPPYYPDHPVSRSDWADYLNSVMVFDKKVGITLKRLEDEGLADNTIVVLFTDHGRAMPRGKQWLYDPGLKIPLVVYVPDGVKPPKGYTPKSRTDRLISGIDLPATSLELAGIDHGLVMQGRPFLGDADAGPRKYVFGARDRAGEAMDRIRSVRDDRYLYIRNFMPERPYSQKSDYKELYYPISRLMFRLHRDGKLGPIPSLFMAETRPQEELYDTKADPHNINNLAEDPAYTERLASMRSVLKSWIIETNDQGRFLEDPAIREEVAQEYLVKNAKKIKKMIDKEGPWRDGISN